jgi:hypothetical protein
MKFSRLTKKFECKNQERRETGWHRLGHEPTFLQIEQALKNRVAPVFLTCFSRSTVKSR